MLPESAGQATGIHVFSQGNSLCRTVLYHCLPYFRKRYRERYRKLIYLFYRLFLRLSIVAIQYTILNCILSFTPRNSRIPSKKNDRFAIGSGRFIERVDLYFVSSGTGKCDPLLRSCRGGMSSEQTVPEQQERQKPQYDPRSCSNCGIAFRILPQQTIRQCQNTRAKQQIQPAFLLKQHAEFCIWEQQFIEQSEQTEQQQCFHQNASEHAPNWRESRADQAKRPNRALPDAPSRQQHERSHDLRQIPKPKSETLCTRSRRRQLEPLHLERARISLLYAAGLGPSLPHSAMFRRSLRSTEQPCCCKRQPDNHACGVRSKLSFRNPFHPHHAFPCSAAYKLALIVRIRSAGSFCTARS